MQGQPDYETLLRENAALRDELAARRSAVGEPLPDLNVLEVFSGLAYYFPFVDGRSPFVCSRCEKLTGYSAADFLEDPNLFEKKVVHPDDRQKRQDVILEACSGRHEYRCEYRILARGSRVVHVSEVGCWVFSDDDKVIARQGFVWDISDKLYRLQEMEKIKHELWESQRSREKLEVEIGNLRRRIRNAMQFENLRTLCLGLVLDSNNALQAILGCAEGIFEENRRTTRNETVNDYVQGIRESLEIARQRIVKLRIFCRAAEPEPRVLYMDSMLPEVNRMLRSVFPKSIKLEIAAFDCGPVFFDEALLIQVIMTLCSLVCKELPDQTGTLRLTLDEIFVDGMPGGEGLRGMIPGDYVRLIIGDPLAMETAAKRDYEWKPGRSEEDGEEDNLPGMLVPRKLVVEHNGVVSVRHAEDGREIFTLYFPVVEDEETGFDDDFEDEFIVDEEYESEEVVESLGYEGEDEGKWPPPARGERLLLVDDNESIVSLCSVLCETLGYEVTFCQQAQEALRIFADDPSYFDVVLTDQTMPEITGLELAARLLQIRPDISIVLATGYDEMINEEMLRSNGVLGLLRKPATSLKIAQMLHRICRGGTYYDGL